MTDKAKERIMRACCHTIMLRSHSIMVSGGDKWLDVWKCADCGWEIELAPVLEESAT